MPHIVQMVQSHHIIKFHLLKQLSKNKVVFSTVSEYFLKLLRKSWVSKCGHTIYNFTTLCDFVPHSYDNPWYTRGGFVILLEPVGNFMKISIQVVENTFNCMLWCDLALVKGQILWPLYNQWCCSNVWQTRV